MNSSIELEISICSLHLLIDLLDFNVTNLVVVSAFDVASFLDLIV
jgi:hypothetical protein